MTVRIIAEAGINHQGSYSMALDMIRCAKDCGADTVKFQHIDPEHFNPDLIWQSYNMQALFRRVRLPVDDLRALKEFAEGIGLSFLCTPQTVGDFEDLLSIGITEVKISSDNLGNQDLLFAVDGAGIDTIISTGMATSGEAVRAMLGRGLGTSNTIMVCTSEYPCPPESTNIRRLGLIASTRPQTYLGFSDHTIGNTAAIMAVALGATVIEKHFTLSHDLDGPDHAWSADPEELASYVKAIREAELMLGSGEFKPTEKELETKKLLGV